MASEKGKKRRRYDEGFKAKVMAQCDLPGSSVAQVAMSHGVNANVVHRWRQLAREGGGGGGSEGVRQSTVARGAADAPAFVALALPEEARAAAGAGDIRLELRRGATAVVITWPLSYAGELAAFTRELLR